MMATPWGPSAVPTGGAGVAWPAGIWILTTARTFFLAMESSRTFGRRGRRARGAPDAIDKSAAKPAFRASRARAVPGRRRSELGDLAELELDRGLAPEDVDQHLELELVFVDLDDLAGEVGERAFLDPHGLAHLVLEAGPGSLSDLLLGAALWHEERLDVAPGQRRRLGALADEPGHARRVADDEPRLVVELRTHEQVAREHLALGHDPLAVAEVDVVLHGDDHLVDRLLGIHRHDAGLEVLLDLLLVARLGVHHEPAARPVVRALGGRLRLEKLVVGEDVGLGRAGVLHGLAGDKLSGDSLSGDSLIGVGISGAEVAVGPVGVGLVRHSVGGVRVSGVGVGDRVSSVGVGDRVGGLGLGSLGRVAHGLLGQGLVGVDVTHRSNSLKMASPNAKSRVAMYAVRITTVNRTMTE